MQSQDADSKTDLAFELGVVSVNEGDRIAQLIIEKISTPEVVEVESLDATVRGEGGFGSTGGFGAAASNPKAAAVAADLPAETTTSS